MGAALIGRKESFPCHCRAPKYLYPVKPLAFDHAIHLVLYLLMKQTFPRYFYSSLLVDFRDSG